MKSEVNRIIYVVPREYGQLPEQDRYAIARLIGQITRLEETSTPETIMLMGPGRWGTTTPSLGVPVTFAEMNNIAIVCEIPEMHEDLSPDVSMGTHFFAELVEMDMLYFAVFPRDEDNVLNRKFFQTAPNRLAELIPSAAKWAHVVKIIDTANLHHGKILQIHTNNLKQSVICYFTEKENNAEKI